jgi:hypothetical protein
VKQITLRKITPLIGASLVLACVAYFVNFWLFSSRSRISPIDALFFEGIMFIIIGALVCIGSGGLSRTSQRAAVMSALAGAVGKDVIGPSEIFRRDAWRPKGFLRAGLVFILTGTILIIIYFVSLYTAP